MATPETFHRPLTWHQRRLLTAVREFHIIHGYAPTVREIQLALGNATPATVHTRLVAARERGLVHWVDGQVRTLTITDTGNRLLDA